MVHPARGGALSDPGRSTIIPADLTAVVVFLRHGESTFIAEGRFQGASDPPLSPLGERQAALAAARLAAPDRSPALPIPASAPIEIVHSPLSRAAATAAAVRGAIAATRGDAPLLRGDPGFREIGQGRWEGRLRADIEAADGDILAGWRRDPLVANAPGGERVVDADARARPAVDRVIATLGRAAAAGSEGRAPRTPGATVTGYPGPARADTPWALIVAHDGIFKVVLLALLDLPLTRFWTFPLGLCAITVVELRDGRGILRAHNLVEHLAPLSATGEPGTDGVGGEP